MDSNMNRLDSCGLGVAPKAVVRQKELAAVKPIILVAEDSEDGREMLEMMLRLKGYDVVVAADGLQAVELALTKVPDLILLDLELPQLNGLAVTKNLRRHPKLKAVPIIVISGHDPQQCSQLALDSGCNDYLCKPIDFEELEKILVASVPLNKSR